MAGRHKICMRNSLIFVLLTLSILHSTNPRTAGTNSQRKGRLLNETEVYSELLTGAVQLVPFIRGDLRRTLKYGPIKLGTSGRKG